MNYTELRLKLIHFFRKYKKILFIVLSIWGIIVFVNHALKNNVKPLEPTTTYEPHSSVIDNNSSTPKRIQTAVERYIEEYVNCCNNEEYEKAFNLLSEECRLYGFDNDPTNFLKHVFLKFPNKRLYTIQNYSNMKLDGKKVFVYEVKYTADLLATGLTNAEYAYTSDKMAFYEDDDGNIKMSVGGFIYKTPIQSIVENDYLKIDVQDKIVRYTDETYTVKFTNRSNNIVVISDGAGNSELEIQLNQETRKAIDNPRIVLNPGQSITKELSFEKFADDGDISKSLIFGSIRVMEKYSGTQTTEKEIIQQEIENALAKLSMIVNIKEK